jgi:hypothetical protein
MRGLREFARILFYDEAGVPIGVFGRPGEGPGEFKRLVRAGWIGDTLWVSDTALRRVTLIGPDLALIRTVSNPVEAQPAPGDTVNVRTWSSPSPYAVLAGGETVSWAFRIVEGGPVEDDASLLMRMSPDGTILNRVAWIPAGGEAFVSMDVGNGGIAMGLIPFRPRRSWDVAPDGSRAAFLTSPTSEAEPSFTVTVFDTTGASIVDRTFPYEPVAIPGTVLDSAIEATTARRDSTIRGDLASLMWDAAPSVYAEADWIRIGDDNRIWVRLRRTPDSSPGLVLSPTGEPEYRVLLPRNVSLAAMNGTHVWVLERDEFDVESVVRYRVGQELFDEGR